MNNVLQKKKSDTYLTEKRQKKMEMICWKAARVFSEKGFSSSSLKDVSRAAGLSKGGIYHYFSSKEELLFVIADTYMDILLDGLENKLRKIPDPKEQIRFFIRRHIDFHSKNVHESRIIMHGYNDFSPGNRKLVKKKTRRYIDILKATIDAFFEDSAVSAVKRKIALYSLLGMFNWIYWWYDPKGVITPAELSEEIYRIFLFDLKKNII